MTIALVASAFLINKTAGGGGSGGTTGGVDTTGATLLVATFGYFPGGTISDSKGNTWTQAVSHALFWTSNIYYVANPTVGSGHTFTMSGTSNANAQFSAWSGVATASPLDITNFGSSGGASPTQPGSVTPTNAASLVISHFIKNNGSDAPTIDSSFVTIDNGNGGGAGGGAYGGAYLTPDTAAVNPHWSWTDTSSNGNNIATIAVFKPTTAAASTAHFLPMLGVGGTVALAGAGRALHMAATNPDPTRRDFFLLRGKSEQ